MLKLWVIRSLGLGGVLAIGLVLCSHQAAFAADVGKTINIVKNDVGHFVFSDPDAKIEAGQSITWVAIDPHTPHSLVSGDTPADDFQPTGTFENPETKTQKFEKPGVIHYFCLIHPKTLIGTITVTAVQTPK
jgi:plastocyanin